MSRYEVSVTVEGAPNSGKTTVMLLIVKALEEYGFSVDANPSLVYIDDGSSFTDMSSKQIEDRKKKMFHPTFRDSITNRRKISVRQKQTPRSER